MARYHLIDELHVQIRVPRDLPPKNLATVRRFLANSTFQNSVLDAVRRLFAGRAALASVRVRLAR
jgi:hypothetical protein